MPENPEIKEIYPILMRKYEKRALFWPSKLVITQKDKSFTPMTSVFQYQTGPIQGRKNSKNKENI